MRYKHKTHRHMHTHRLLISKNMYDDLTSRLPMEDKFGKDKSHDGLALTALAVVLKQ